MPEGLQYANTREPSFSADNRYLAVTKYSDGVVFDLDDGRLSKQYLDGGVYFLADGKKLLVYGPDRIEFYDGVVSDEPFAVLKNPQSYVFQESGAQSTILLLDYPVSFFEATVFKVLSIPDFRTVFSTWTWLGSYSGGALSPDLSMAAVSYPGDRIDVVAVPSGKRITSFNLGGWDPPWVTRMAFSEDGQLLASYTDGFLRVWNVETGKLKSYFEMPNTNGRGPSTFTLQDGLMATVTSTAVSIREFDTGYIRCQREGRFFPNGHTAKFSPDGTLLAVAETRNDLERYPTDHISIYSVPPSGH